MTAGPGDKTSSLRLSAAHLQAELPYGELVRYGAASAVAFAGDFSVLVLLTELADIHYLAAAAAGFSVGVLIAYLLCIRWVFSNRRLSSASAESTIFLLIGLAGLVVNHIMMFSLTELVSLPYVVSKLGSVGVVFFFNFSLRKAVLFTAPAVRKG